MFFIVDDYRPDGTYGPAIALPPPRKEQPQEEDPFLAIQRIFWRRDHEVIVTEDGVRVIRPRIR